MRKLLFLALLIVAATSSSLAAVAFRTASFTGYTTANANPGEPTGTANGDVLVGMIVVDGTCSAPSLPTGWNVLYTVTSTRGTTANGFKVAVGWIARGGSAATTTFTNCGTYEEAYILAVSGGSTSALDSQSASGATATAASHNPDPPSTTVVAANSLAVAGAVHWGGSQTGGWTASTSYTIRSNNANGNDGVMETRLLTASGAENPSAFGNANTGSFDYWDGFTISIAPAGAITTTIMPPRVM